MSPNVTVTGCEAEVGVEAENSPFMICSMVVLPYGLLLFDSSPPDYKSLGSSEP